MFREMKRKKQALSQKECIRLLCEQPRGVLALLGDGDYPYAVPMDHWYCEEDGMLYFHSSKEGHKIDAIRRHEKASFCVYDQGFRREGEWALNIKSVIVFGTIRLIEAPEEITRICRSLSYKYTSDSAYIEEEIRLHAERTLCFALAPEQINGKIVNES